MIRRLRLAATAILFAAAWAVPLITAPPALADVAACSSHLAESGVEGDQAAACEKGAAGDLYGCVSDLVEVGVEPPTAIDACILAES